MLCQQQNKDTNMGFLKKMARSADLANGMADRRDLDLAERILRNPDTAGVELSRMIMRCAGCSDQDGCEKLQACSSHLDAAPDYCRNKTLFDVPG